MASGGESAGVAWLVEIQVEVLRLPVQVLCCLEEMGKCHAREQVAGEGAFEDNEFSKWPKRDGVGLGWVT